MEKKNYTQGFAPLQVKRQLYYETQKMLSAPAVTSRYF